jgi:DNA-directed RNA polymerase subunit RPC12/RpoP
MSILFDPNHVRVWPPSGAGSSFPEERGESPPEYTPPTLGGIVDDVLEAFGGEKTSALRKDLHTSAPTLKDIWRHADAHPIALLLLLLERYGTEFTEWEVETLKLTMERDGLAVSNRVWNKICAGRVVLESPSPWRQWEVFHWVCRGLAGETPNFVFLEEPELGHLVVGYQIMKALDKKRPTGIEVDKYIAAAFKHEGIPVVPSPLDFAQRELEERKLRCKNCGAIHRDDNDVRCISCSSRELIKEPYEFEELKTQCLELFEKRRALPLEKAVEGLPDSGVGSAVYRLLVEWDYADTVQSQLLQQLRMIGGKR